MLTYSGRMVPTAQRPPVNVYQAIADPTRRVLLDLLGEGEQPVKGLAHSFPISRPAVSQHLRVLLEAGLVSERRVGRERRYQLEAAPLREVYRWLSRYERFWEERLDALGRYLDRQGTAPDGEQG